MCHIDSDENYEFCISAELDPLQILLNLENYHEYD
jgi:hypothetical protein